MTNNDTAQPLSRRERRALEQAANQSVLVQPTVVAPPTAPTQFVAQPVVVPPPPPLSRRERRQLETGSSPVQDTGVTPGVAVPRIVDIPVPPLLPPPNSPPLATLPQEPAKPLPPVFGVAVNSARFETYDDGSVAVPTPANFTPSRMVGDLTTATSSLIMPHTPTVDIAGPLGDTGEIVVTGQIMLPSSLSERGSAPALLQDNDHDEVMDAYVTGAMSPTAKPMRASQAVSGKGDDTDILLVRRARWGTATVVTALGAGVLGLAALGLFVLAMLTDVVG
jgi:hypothetical protein